MSKGWRSVGWIPFVLIAVVLLSVATVMAAQDDAGPAIRLAPDDAVVVARGEKVYQQQCASCHGRRLEGQFDWRRRLPNGRLPAPPHDASGHTWHHPDAMLFEITKRGPAAIVGSGYESDMPGYDGVLNDAEIIAVLSFIKSRWPAEIRDRHDRMNARVR